MRKAILSFLQIKSIKNASSLATDGKGNVIAGKKSDEKEIDLSKYQLKPKVIEVDLGFEVFRGELQLTNEYTGNIIYIKRSPQIHFYLDKKSITRIGDSIEIIREIKAPSILKIMEGNNLDFLYDPGNQKLSGAPQTSKHLDIIPVFNKITITKISTTKYLIEIE
ncbi:hypothetical protein [Tenacibaculum piscium]|uniref:hypothetical protein n=1 Tax=Tenacibaculum piscium TaxID=1458515 RepID=UPI001F1E47BC|nr:hypothetical protein [Tenacibaculum piscium]